MHMINAVSGGWKNEDCSIQQHSICVIESIHLLTTQRIADAVNLPTEDVKDCPPQQYTNPSGVLTSPLWPANYPDNADCYYFVPSGKRVNLTLAFFETESCCDWLYIHDGPIDNSPTIASLRGIVANGTSYLSTSNSFTLRFTSDESTNDKGFYAQYTAF